MNHRLTPELEELRRTVEEFAHDVVAPKIGDFYERHEFPYEIVREMGRMGLFGLPFPEEYGGMGGDYLALGIALADKKTTLDSLIDLPGANEHVHEVELRANGDYLSDRYRLLNMAALALQYGGFVGPVAAGRDTHYYKLALDTSSLKFVTLPFTSVDTRVLLRTKLRYSGSALPAYEQLSLGGADGVRAFTVSDFSADSAAQVTAEWYFPLPGGAKVNDLFQFGIFSDSAYGVQNSYQSAVSDKWAYLSGFGVLLKFAWNDWFSAQLSVAHPSSSKSNLEGVGDNAKSAQSFLSFTWVVD